MVWIVTKERSYQAVEINTSKNNKPEEGEMALWIERPNGMAVKIVTGDKEIIEEHKNAIDFAVKNGHKTYELV